MSHLARATTHGRVEVGLPKQEADSSLPRQAAAAEAGLMAAGHPPHAEQEATGKLKAPAVCYLGFRTTDDGREYTLRVTDGLERRLFVLLITREAFASREARFQDAPDLCFGKLQRELVADPGLLPGPRLVLTTQDLLEYRNARDKRPPVRTRRVSGT